MFCIIDYSFGYLCFVFCLKNKSIMFRSKKSNDFNVFIENYNYLNLKNCKEILKENILYSYTKNS